VVVVSDTELQVLSPTHQTGVIDVFVVDPDGSSNALPFTYLAATVTAVDPPTGPMAGGTLVTITGACFTGATNVLFGNTPATRFTVISDTQVTAISPAEFSGAASQRNSESY